MTEELVFKLISVARDLAKLANSSINRVNIDFLVDYFQLLILINNH
jgi:hypothetical protein